MKHNKSHPSEDMYGPPLQMELQQPQKKETEDSASESEPSLVADHRKITNFKTDPGSNGITPFMTPNITPNITPNMTPKFGVTPSNGITTSNPPSTLRLFDHTTAGSTTTQGTNLEVSVIEQDEFGNAMPSRGQNAEVPEFELSAITDDGDV